MAEPFDLGIAEAAAAAAIRVGRLSPVALATVVLVSTPRPTRETVTQRAPIATEGT